MSKTNFKCMYLVDDRLYKTISHQPNTSQNWNVSPSTILSKNTIYVPTRIKEEIDTIVTQPNQSVQPKSSQAESIPGNPTSNESVQSTAQFDQIIPEASSPTSRKEDQTPTIDPAYHKMLSEPLVSGEKSMDIDDSICDCQEKKIEPCSINSKENYKESVNDKTRMADHSKQTIINEKKRNIQDYIEDPELEELRERFRKIREDIDYPPSKTDLITQNDRRTKEKRSELKDIEIPPTPSRKKFITQTTEAKKDRKVMYICTICRVKFRRMKTLTRHMQNIHGEFFENNNNAEKRKNKDESPQQRKKFISDGRRKRNMDAPEKSHKRRKEELKCSLCQEYFKTELALSRHGRNVHDLNSLHPRGEKRTGFRGKNLSQQYVKRQKNEVKIPVEYVNYF